MNFSERNYDHLARDQEGNRIISPNNRERDIAYLFHMKEDIKSKGMEIAEASFLSEEMKSDFRRGLDEAVERITEDASSLAIRDSGIHDYRYWLTNTVNAACKKDATTEEKAEWNEVVKAFSGELSAIANYEALRSWEAKKYDIDTAG